jgi:two-component system phosphate regulon sensor histidine kinase PhoR
VLGHEEPWSLTLRVVPRTTPRAVAVALARALGEPPPPSPPPPRGGGVKLEQLALRFPFAVVGVRADQRVAFANGLARKLLGSDAVRTGALLTDGAPRELGPLARRLVEFRAPLRPTHVRLSDGRTLEVSGIAATADDPAVLFLQDATEQHRYEEVMREFLRNAAHQLRTPLTGVVAAIEMLQGGAKDDPATLDLFLGHLETHAGRLSRIARGLLTLARAEGGAPVMVDIVALRPVVDAVVGAVDPRPGVTIHANCPRQLSALAMPDLLQEALAALVENAVKHTLAGEIRIDAAAVAGHVTVSVADSGPGILPEFHDRIFDPFFQAPAVGEGFGLGLAIAAQAVRAMRGDIGVSSVLGEGTTFTVRLPSGTVVR